MGVTGKEVLCKVRVKSPEARPIQNGMCGACRTPHSVQVSGWRCTCGELVCSNCWCPDLKRCHVCTPPALAARTRAKIAGFMLTLGKGDLNRGAEQLSIYRKVFGADYDRT
jgi:hypothetical protein